MRAALLRARDPSIIAFNNPEYSTVNLINSNEARPTESQDENCINVYLRVKAGVDNYEELYEINKSKTFISKIPEGSHSNRNNKDGEVTKRKYEFSKIFGPMTTQEEIFNELVKPKLVKFINGDNCTVMTYGVSSSGKTYTIVGTGQEPGVVPRSLEYIFRTLPTLSDQPSIRPLANETVAKLSDKEILKLIEIKQGILNHNWPNSDRFEHIKTYCTMQQRLSQEPVAEVEYGSNLSINMWISFAEIYNEHIHDLLQREPPNGKAKQKLKLGNAKGHTYVKNLTQVHVSNGLEAYQVLQYGLHHLNYAKTKINDHSSRSHSIFTIMLLQANAEDTKKEYSISRFRFCDLAGAERSKKTMNVGDRLKESNNINTSLLVLGRCITAVRNAQKAADQRLIPFRESKLTQIFQRALSGFEDISMIVNVNPCRELFDETQHVLNFSAIAKEIVVTQQPKVTIVKDDRFSQLVGARSTEYPLNADPEILEREMRNQKLKNELSEFISSTEIEEMDQFLEANEKCMVIINKYTNMNEMSKEQWKEEYDMREAELKSEYKRKLKAFKMEYLESLKGGLENPEDLSADETSEEDDDSAESDEEGPPAKRLRKRSADVETITVYSSEEEDDLKFWQQKVRSQEIKIEEHHKTIAAMKGEIERLREVANRSRNSVDSAGSENRKFS